MNLGLILMASGFGSRFGSNKLEVVAQGVPLYERALATYAQVPFARHVAVSQYEIVLDAARARGFQAIHNPLAAEGVSASIRLGMEAMSGLDGALFAVCDQPWLTAESVQRLCAAFEARPDKITALSWQGRKGNPVLFPAALFGELSALTGDTGGSAVIRAHPGLLTLVEAGSERELQDIDAPGDLVL